MRNAQKNALMALFAAMEEANDSDKRRAPMSLPEPASGEPIVIDRLWLLSRGAKGRA